ncbi:thioredoxin family protein [Marinigracilibium pacificum]|uniref:Thioredoxin n=1 Tax=Marinigracilibium pacificum TaxID=2729599 RepID=A0A848J7J9_9BACT|nr:thioredoxin domain-containing protein [Marinigracilibium pacificum]NMM50404.1 thioredoxin [Marinigracilibium pacificum]
MRRIELTDENFESVSKEESLLLVRFKAEWCGSCKSTQKAFDSMVEEGQLGDITIAEMDAPDCPKTRLTAGVYAVPFYALFKNGTLIDSVSTSNLNEVKKLVSIPILS